MEATHRIRLATIPLSLALALMLGAFEPIAAQPAVMTPPDFTMAFLGDQGLGSDSRAVLNLIKDEGAEAIIHLGDFDYHDDPAAWDQQLTDVLGASFPQFAVAGNHDDDRFYGEGGYQEFLLARMNRLGIPWHGEMGVQYSMYYKGLFIVMTTPDVFGSNHDEFIHDQLAEDNSVWRIAGWHKNMTRMQTGQKGNDTGWGVYEEARKGGAIIATGHEHSYARTHLLSSCIDQTVASISDTLTLTRGETFSFVSGLGGRSIRNQDRDGDWWASIYTSDQDANFGALFGVFNLNGDTNRAHFYFKDIDGNVPDEFWLISQVQRQGETAVEEPDQQSPESFVLLQNYPNPFSPDRAGVTSITFWNERPEPVRLSIYNLKGRRVRTLVDNQTAQGRQMAAWDGRDDSGQALPSGTYFYQLDQAGRTQTRKLLLLK